MEPFLGIIVGALAISVPILAAIAQKRQRRADFLLLARELRLANVREARHRGRTMSVEGERDDFRIRVTQVAAARVEHGNPLSDIHVNPQSDVRIVVDGRSSFPRTIDLRLEDIATSIARQFGRKEIEIGDEAFDDAVFIRGPELALQAALDPRTRRLVCELLQAGGRIADGVVCTRVRAPTCSPATAAAALERALEVARRLSDPENILARLCERFRWEHAPGVRLRLLDLLADRFPAEPEARSVFREALLATDDRLRLHAARVLGEEGRQALLDVASCTDGDNAQAVRAIELLGRRLPIEDALAALNDALRVGHRNVARAVIQTLGLHGGQLAIDRLGAVLAVGEVDLAAASARALAATNDPGVEARLLGALPSAQPGVTFAVCEALGRVGSIAAVPELRAIASATATDRAVARAAGHAIAAIQSRLAGASPGQVSLAEGQAGDLTLTNETETGRVSLIDR